VPARLLLRLDAGRALPFSSGLPMEFRGHLNGALAAAGLAAGLTLFTGYAEPDAAQLGHFLADPFAPGPMNTLVGVAATAWFMALFPDLDVASVPQRWFLRAMFALLVLCLWLGRMDLFVVVALAALLPLLHRHRGWTHHPLAPWLVSASLALAHEWLRSRNAWLLGFSWHQVWDLLREYWLYLIAAALGHGVHLLLDSRKVRWLPFIRNAPGHH